MARLNQLRALPMRQSTVESELEFQFPEMEVVFLGTGAGSPSPFRGSSAIALKLPSQNWLFDVGEGTVLQIAKSALKIGQVNRIFITHLHGDHIFGLPGLICSYDTFLHPDRDQRIKTKQRLSLYGPPGLYNYLAVSLSSSKLNNSKVTVNELQIGDETFPAAIKHPNISLNRISNTESIWNVFEDSKYTVKAAKIDHSVQTFGFVVEEKPFPGRFNVEKAQSLGLEPGPAYRKLIQGCPVELPDGSVIEPQDVVGDPVTGRKVAILGDTCNAFNMVDMAQGADLVIHEATLAPEKRNKMISRGHATPAVAGLFARRAKATALAMTHFSVTSNARELAKARTVARNYFRKHTVFCAQDLLRIPIRRVNSVLDS